MFAEASTEFWSWAWQIGGPLFVVLTAFGLAVWAVLQWIGRELIIPGRDRMFRHLDTVENAVGTINDSVRDLASAIRGDLPPPEVLDDKSPDRDDTA